MRTILQAACEANGRSRACTTCVYQMKGDYICKFSNGMWQVFGQEAYMNEIKK